MTEAAPLAPRRRQRLAADLPAGPVCALAALAPTVGPRAYVAFRPLGDGRIAAEAGGGAVCGLLEVEGQLSQPLAIPTRALLTLGRRHPSARVLVIDSPHPDGPALMLLRSLDETGSATVSTPAAELEAGSVEALLADVPVLPLGDERAALLDPRLLRQGLAAMAKLCPGPVRVSLPAHDALGLLVTGRPDLASGSGVLAATVAVARMIDG